MNGIAAAAPVAAARDAQRALRLVVLLGVVSLFADMTYEGARAIAGPFLAVLGASGTVVGLVSGLGELAGYALRLWSGRLADRTHRYWTITIVGYAVNLLAVPLLALAGHWSAAAALMVLERVGKAIRTPARDVMLSYATTHTGRGWGFGLHEALDQTGATLGPLVVAGVLLWRGDYRTSFAVLLVPALAALALLLVGRAVYPRPQDLERAGRTIATQGFSRAFWVYVSGTCLVAAAYADYPLLAYHFERVGSVPKEWIAVFYAIAMAVDGVAALVMGGWFDRRGIVVLVGATALSALVAPLAFGGGFGVALAGAVLWGIGMGAQESIMRAAIAELTPAERRGSAYGLFNMLFGVAWFAGSALMGWLYDVSIPALIAFSVVLQGAALPLFVVSHQLAARGATPVMSDGIVTVAPGVGPPRESVEIGSTSTTMAEPRPKFIGFFRLIDACKSEGCPVCRCLEADTRHYLDTLLYERVNDAETRARLHASWGFCNWHGWMLRETPDSAFGSAILGEDLLRVLMRRFERFPVPRTGVESTRRSREMTLAQPDAGHDRAVG